MSTPCEAGGTCLALVSDTVQAMCRQNQISVFVSDCSVCVSVCVCIHTPLGNAGAGSSVKEDSPALWVGRRHTCLSCFALPPGPGWTHSSWACCLPAFPELGVAQRERLARGPRLHRGRVGRGACEDSRLGEVGCILYWLWSPGPKATFWCRPEDQSFSKFSIPHGSPGQILWASLEHQRMCCAPFFHVTGALVTLLINSRPRSLTAQTCDDQLQSLQASGGRRSVHCEVKAGWDKNHFLRLLSYLCRALGLYDDYVAFHCARHESHR